MSNRRKIKHNTADLPELLGAPILGLVAESGIPMQMDGGCDHCDAYQKVWREREGIWHISVVHDDDCQWYLDRQRRAVGGVR